MAIPTVCEYRQHGGTRPHTTCGEELKPLDHKILFTLPLFFPHTTTVLRVAMANTRRHLLFAWIFLLSVKQFYSDIYIDKVLKLLNSTTANLVHGSKPQRWLLDPSRGGKYSMTRAALDRIKDLCKIQDILISDSDLKRLPILNNINENPREPLQFQPYSREISNFIIPNSTNQMKFRTDLIWYNFLSVFVKSLKSPS
jgi:hypothetical protein